VLEKRDENVSEKLEPFVDSAAVAAHTGMAVVTVGRWARKGLIPAHPAPGGTKRRTWMFKLSEVDLALASRCADTIALRPGCSAEEQ
jgi:hypothetical protein